MKRYLITTVLIAFFGVAVGQNKTYSIDVNVKNMPDRTIFYLIKNKENGTPDTLQRVKALNGKISFKGSSPLTGELHFVKMDTSIVKLPKGRLTWLGIMLDNTKIEILTDIESWPEATIRGASSTIKYRDIADLIRKAFDITSAEMKASGNDRVKTEELKKKYHERVTNILRSYPDDIGTAALTHIWIPFLSLSENESIYQILNKNVQNSYYGELVKKALENQKLQSKIGIGKVIPDFYIVDTQGKRQSIIQLAQLSTYTLIDFWAYWCKPCRAEIPNLRKAYDVFHEKGFNIVGVSTDPNILAWKKAIKEDNTPWLHGIQEGNVSKDIFGITAIPAYILINNKAEIVSMDMVSTVTSKFAGTREDGALVYVADKGGFKLKGGDLYNTIEGLVNTKR